MKDGKEGMFTTFAAKGTDEGETEIVMNFSKDQSCGIHKDVSH